MVQPMFDPGLEPASRPVPASLTITYRILRGDTAAEAFIVSADGAATRLPPRHDLTNHSPDGFNYGYGGSGPSQLAIALLAHALDDEMQARRLYQAFKQDVVGRVPLVVGRWEISGRDIRRWAQKQGAIGPFLGTTLPDRTTPPERRTDG